MSDISTGETSLQTPLVASNLCFNVQQTTSSSAKSVDACRATIWNTSPAVRPFYSAYIAITWTCHGSNHSSSACNIQIQSPLLWIPRLGEYDNRSSRSMTLWADFPVAVNVPLHHMEDTRSVEFVFHLCVSAIFSQVKKHTNQLQTQFCSNLHIHTHASRFR